MRAWAVHGVELPFGDEPTSWWIDGSGEVHDRPVAGADLLPGGYFLPGLVDAHAHPAVGSGPAGLVSLDARAARANLTAWAQAGITLVRDVGSPRGLTLQLGSAPGMPTLQAAGRFLAPAGRDFPDLLDAPVVVAGLVVAALAEVGRGAAWVKVIADFPDPAAGTDAQPTYPSGAIARLVAAAHQAGARVAVHSTVPDAGQLVAAGVDDGPGAGAGAGRGQHLAAPVPRRPSCRRHRHLPPRPPPGPRPACSPGRRRGRRSAAAIIG